MLVEIENAIYAVIAIIILFFLLKERNFMHVKASIAQILIKGFRIDIWLNYLFAVIALFSSLVMINLVYNTYITKYLILLIFFGLEIEILIYVYNVNKGLKV